MGELQKSLQELTHKGLLRFRTLTTVSAEKTAKRLADERKASHRAGPFRQSLHRSPPTPGSHISLGRQPALSWRREVNHMLKVFVSIQNRLAMLKEEHGQTMAEYGVVLAVITVLVIVALTALSGAISGALNKVTAKL
jgi:Flp pilus assembly pilin Flp